VVVLPLYPQFSISTSGSSLRELERRFYADQTLRQVRNVVIPAWYNRAGYVAAQAALVAKKVDLDPRGRDAPHVFFSAHGLPKKYIDTLADPYKMQMEATVERVMAEMRRMGYANEYTLAYQSKVGPVEWLKPYTDDSIRELAAAGVDSLVVVPIAFVSEHIETLEEIDGEYQELAREAGVVHWQRVPALGVQPEFIDDLADAVVEVLPRIEAPPTSAINEGRPVSLRVVNDLVQLRSKEEAIEYGPVRYEVRRTGFTPNAELINGRIAMSAITLACLWSLYDGTLVSDVVAGRLPFAEPLYRLLG
jgi:ferrochelatase